MKWDRFNKCSAYVDGLYILDRNMSEASIASDSKRNRRYYSLEKNKCSQATVDHFYHKPYAKWEGNV